MTPIPTSTINSNSDAESFLLAGFRCVNPQMLLHEVHRELRPFIVGGSPGVDFALDLRRTFSGLDRQADAGLSKNTACWFWLPRPLCVFFRKRLIW